jgi:hypothetical protein
MIGRRAPFLLRTVIRELLVVAVPALLAAGVLGALPGESRSQGEERTRVPEGEVARPCGEWHRGAGDSSPLDLASVKREYAALRDKVARSLDRLKADAAADLARPFDSKLPACAGEATRTETLEQGKGARLRGRLLYFVAVPDPGRLRLPPEVAADPGAQILVVRTPAMKDLPEIASALGRPITLGSADLARALGVRCANTWLKVSEKGDAVELHESR